MPAPKDPIKYAEWCTRISKSLKGHKRNLGKHPSQETRDKISSALKGKYAGKNSPLLGTTRSEETRKNISDAHKGIRPSEEKTKKWTAMIKSLPRTKEWKDKISIALKDRPLSEEHRKKLSDARKGRFGGENCPSWRGGISFEPYCIKFNKEFKERVRAFFNYTCQECGKTQSENGKKLHIHHANFNKESCCDSSIPLFIPLCNSCHSKTNGNRIFWEYWFTEMINRLYAGKCYYTKEEMNLS